MAKSNLAKRADELLAQANCDPITAMAMIANGELPCNLCRGRKTVTKMWRGKQSEEFQERDFSCWVCKGTGREPISVELRGKMAAELAKYRHAQLKAVELTGEGGGPVHSKLEVVFVKPE